jgi:hypothetical protein
MRSLRTLSSCGALESELACRAGGAGDVLREVYGDEKVVAGVEEEGVECFGVSVGVLVVVFRCWRGGCDVYVCVCGVCSTRIGQRRQRSEDIL